MQRMIAKAARTKAARISIATCCVALAACGTEGPPAQRTATLNRYPPAAEWCQVGIQSCMTLNPEPPRTCLASGERCGGQPTVQLVDVTTGR
jgi:hypothetical protein